MKQAQLSRRSFLRTAGAVAGASLEREALNRLQDGGTLMKC